MKLLVFVISILALLIASVASDTLECTTSSREILVSSRIGGTGSKGGSSKGSKGNSSKGSKGSASKGSKGSKGESSKGSKGSNSKGVSKGTSKGRMLTSAKGSKGTTAKGSKGATTKGSKGTSTKGSKGGSSKSSKSGNEACRTRSKGSTTKESKGTSTKGSKGTSTKGSKGSKGSKGNSTKGSKGSKGNSTKGSKGSKGSTSKGASKGTSKGRMLASTKGSKGSTAKGSKGASTKGSKGAATKGSKGNTSKGSKGSKGSTSKGGSSKGSKGSSSKGGGTCDFSSILDIDSQEDSPLEITTVASDGETVSFQVTQGFSSSTVPGFAIFFDSGNDETTCAVTKDVAVDSISQEYTANCNACGFAEITILLYLCDQPSAEEEYCEPLDDSIEYYQFTYEVECLSMCQPTSAPFAPPTPPPPPTALPPTLPPSGGQGDPHFKTWSNEHFEYHGQCDLLLAKDLSFADGLGLQIQIRTKLVRFWSYIKSAAIHIGQDIFEVQGGVSNEPKYWINLEHNGPLSTIGGFPLKIISANRGSKQHQRVTYEIDLSSKYPDQKIAISTFKEFIKVDIQNPSAEAFGDTVGLLGDYKTGDTLARDGITVLDDFRKLGNEWQVLPFEGMLFHSTEKPQYPQRCIEPEDARGIKRRRLGESTITAEDAENACSKLKNPLDRKDCVYDILATQDIEMVGAF